jgi:drug/metabolite transporter (DMT)-like permease
MPKEEEPAWKRGVLDLSAILFLLGGVIGVVDIVLMIPISTIYPFRLDPDISFVLVVVLVVGAICAIEAFECYNYASKRFSAKAGMHGIVAGAFLLVAGLLAGSDMKTQILLGSSILILIAGAINYLCRE